MPMAPVPRSKPKVAMATSQPRPTVPTMLPAAVSAPSKKTSQYSVSPVAWLIGRTSMPGWSMGTMR